MFFKIIYQDFGEILHTIQLGSIEQIPYTLGKSPSEFPCRCHHGWQECHISVVIARRDAQLMKIAEQLLATRTRQTQEPVVVFVDIYAHFFDLRRLMVSETTNILSSRSCFSPRNNSIWFFAHAFTAARGVEPDIPSALQ